MIRVENLVKTYMSSEQVVIHAVNEVSFQVEDGALLFIMGKSGSGKSTLLHIMGGLDKPTAGSIYYNNENIIAMSEGKLSEFRRDNVGFVFQEYHLIPELTAEENIKYPVYLSKQKIDEELWKYLIDSLELSDRLTHLPSQLSGGQQQRVAIARALLTNPQVVLCDEPTGNLDSESSYMVQNLLFQLHETLKKTIIIVTHDEEFSQRGKGDIMRIKDGKIT